MKVPRDEMQLAYALQNEAWRRLFLTESKPARRMRREAERRAVRAFRKNLRAGRQRAEPVAGE